MLIAALAGTAWAQPSTMCPMMEQGWRVHARNVEGGIELDFATTGNPMGIRARAHQLEAQHNHVPAPEAVPSKALAEDTADGARLVVLANDPSRVDELRKEMHARIADCETR
jgi:hypothetical protein